MNSAVSSLTKPFATIPYKISPTTTHHRHFQSLSVAPVRSSGGTSDGETSNSGSDGGGNASSSVPPPPQRITPPDTVEIRFRRGSKKSRRLRKAEGDVNGQPKQKKQPSSPKEWESMTLSEKAVELYMGEKGLLFWLNKFAYASIFIIIGGWILFRFVGPALNLYQLGSPPLSPTDVFKGS